MINELGHFALVLALGVAIIQTILPLVGAHRGWRGWMAVGDAAANAQFLLIAFAFGVLMHAFIVSDFSLQVVVSNSHTLKPMLYKVAGVWGNHEGSLLLWVLILSVFGTSAAWFGSSLPPRLKARVLGVQGSISVAFLGFILLTSNPFLRVALPPFNGQDMNPLLQDPGLAFHPPFLYLGYVGLSMSFSFAVAALIEGRVDAAWGRWVRPWTLVSWIFLTIGIALGSWWAYYELGWGGFWFWDPVENASFMPWLIAAALLHSAIVVEKREALKSWTILLAIIAFGFSLTGTFIVRSGVLTSVHAFANDPARGIFVLMILTFFVGGALALFAVRGSAMEAKGVFQPVSREGALVLNNILLAVAAFVVFTGTLWPVVAEFFGRKLSVGAPFFNQSFTPFFFILALILPFGTVMPWKRGSLGRAVRPLTGAMALAVALLGLVWAMQTGKGALGPVGMALGGWLILGAATDILQRSGRGGMAEKFIRMTRLPRADFGRAMAHSGLGVVIIGVTTLTAWTVEDIRVVQIGERWRVADYELELQGVDHLDGPNYFFTQARIAVWRNGAELGVMGPEKRMYPIAGMPTTEAAIRNGITRDLYLVVGDEQQGGGWTVRTFIKPFANWIWAGAIIMALGGLMSLSDRRYRVAAGAAKNPQGVPAE